VLLNNHLEKRKNGRGSGGNRGDQRKKRGRVRGNHKECTSGLKENSRGKKSSVQRNKPKKREKGGGKEKKTNVWFLRIMCFPEKRGRDEKGENCLIKQDRSTVQGTKKLVWWGWVIRWTRKTF